MPSRQDKASTGLLAWSRRHRWVLITAGALLLIGLTLAIGRILLPGIVLNSINDRIAAADGYSGGVREVRLELLRGSYEIHRIEVFKESAGRREPFFSAPQVSFSVEWLPLLRRRIAGELHVQSPRLHLRGGADSDDDPGPDRGWMAGFEDMMPIALRKMTISNGFLHYADRELEPETEISINNVHVRATALHYRPVAPPAPFPGMVLVDDFHVQGARVEIRVPLGGKSEEPAADEPDDELRFFPVRIGRFSVAHQSFRFLDSSAESRVEFGFDDLEIQARGLHNRTAAEANLVEGPAVVDVIHLRGPRLIVLADESEAETDTGWRAELLSYVPMELDRFVVTDGYVEFIDPESDPVVNLWVDRLQVGGTGLRNRPTADQPFPATLTVEGETVGGGVIRGSVHMEPMAAEPHFIGSLEITDVWLPALNHFLLAYGSIDVAEGEFQLFMEMEASGGRYEGYAKPFFRDLDFSDVEPVERSLLEKIWGRIVAGVAHLVKNKALDELGTRIPFSGEFGDGDVGVWETVVNTLRHGFIEALSLGFDADLSPTGPLRRPEEQDAPAARRADP
jgi:hypothetical protein